MYDDKPGLMDVQKASAILGIACTQYAITTFIHRSPKIAQELRYIDWVATTLYYCIRIGASQDAMVWQRPFWPLALAVVTMIVMGYIAEATDNKYVSPLLCSHIFTFCTKSEVSKSCSTERVSKMRAVLAEVASRKRQ
jgi:hypothetical protein